MTRDRRVLHDARSASPEEEGGFAADPILGVVKTMDLGPLQDVGELYVGLLAATILVPRHQRGLHRRVAARVLDGHPPPDARRAAAAAPALPHAVDRHPRLLGASRSSRSCRARRTSSGDLLVRRAAVVHDGARSRSSACGSTLPDVPRPYRGPGNVTHPRLRRCRCSRSSAGSVHGARVRRDRVLNPTVAAAGVGWLALGIAIYIALPAPPGARPDLPRTRSRSRSPWSTTRRSTTPCSSPLVDGTYDEQVMATAIKLAARRRRGIHVLALVTVPERAADRRAACPTPRRRPTPSIEQARIQGGRRVSGHVEKIRAGQAGRRIIEEAGDMRAAAIVMPLPRRIDGASLFGKTLETVLAERPCRVIIESAPDASRAQRRAAMDGTGCRERRHARAVRADGRDRAGDRRAHAGRGRRPARARAADGRPARRPPAPGACTCGAARASEARCRARRLGCARPVRHRAGLRRRVGVLRGRPRGGARARLHVGRVPRRRDPVLARRRCPTSRARRCTRSAAARPSSRASRSTSWSASSPAGRSCSTT